ncbi:MAG: glycosyltransferase family 4 protein [Elusimicrobiota bacterium]
MNICIVHGYLLTGTGSNIYVRNLAKELVRQGHSVTVLCQEYEPEKIDFVSRFVRFEGERARTAFERPTPYPGRCTVVRPDLGGVLPVYVLDRYPGFEVREVHSMTDAEIDASLARVSGALDRVLSGEHFDLVQSNHLVLQPAAVARAKAARGVRHVVTVHGSALNFSVRRNPYLKKLALEGLASCGRCVCNSRHGRAELLGYFAQEAGLADKTVVIPLGVDVSRFQVLEAGRSKKDVIAGVAADLNALPAQKKARSLEETRGYLPLLAKAALEGDFERAAAEVRARYETWSTDADAGDKLQGMDWSAPVVLFFGKYRWTKGAHFLAAAAPLILEEHPETRFLAVGCGDFREMLEPLVHAISSGDKDLLLRLVGLADAGGGPSAPRYLGAFFEGLKREDRLNAYLAAGCGLDERFLFTGIMHHRQLARLLACVDAVAAPSVFPEAFGLVGVEALAAGTVPLVACHSGFADVVEVLSAGFGKDFGDGLLDGLRLEEGLTSRLAGSLVRQLGHLAKLSGAERDSLRERAHRLAAAEFSWEATARRLLAD